MLPQSAMALLWVAWLGSWLLASRWTATTVAQQSSASRLVQSVPIWIGAIALFRSPAWLLSISLLPESAARRWSGVAAVALGFALTWWARIHLGRYWSSAVTLKAGHTLIRSGPYRVTRHPIYTGLLVAVAGTAVVRGTLGSLVGSAFILLGLVLKLREEEQFLRRQFGSAYETYQTDVPALIPLVR